MTIPTNGPDERPDPMPEKPQNPPHGPSGVTRPSINQLSQGPGTNTGHGHIWKRPDRMLARCGGPGLCLRCQADQEEFTRDQSPVIFDRVDRIEVTWPYGRGREFTATPEVVEGWVDQINELRAERDRVREALGSLRAEFSQDVHDDRVLDTWSATLTTDEMAAYSEGRTPAPPMHPTNRDLDRMEGP
jgi:hypothetical protein